jgi:hypothetical protein
LSALNAARHKEEKYQGSPKFTLTEINLLGAQTPFPFPQFNAASNSRLLTEPPSQIEQTIFALNYGEHGGIAYGA